MELIISLLVGILIRCYHVEDMKKEAKKNYDLRKILKPFENKWVALTSDNKKVVSSGDTLNQAASGAKSKNIVFMKVLPFHVSYAPTAL